MVTASQQEELAGSTYLRLILLGALIGIPAAVVASGFLELVHVLQSWLWDDLPRQLGLSSPPWYLVIGLPVLGALIVLLARARFPGDGGHSPLGGLSADPTPPSYGPGVALAALGTLAFGAVLGPEAPLIALGSVVGLAVTRFVQLGSREKAVIAAAGSCSAVSALFGGPLVAGVLMLEAGVGMGAMVIPVLLPGLVAAAVGYVVFIGLGDWGGFPTTALSFSGLPPYDGTKLVDLVLAVVVGVLTAMLVVAVRLVAHRVADMDQSRLRMPGLLLVGGVTVGAIAYLADALGADSQDVLFSGQTAIPSLVTEGSAKIVLTLLAAKALAYAISLGCGFRGGPVFPAIFLGVAIATLGVQWLDMSPTFAVAIGTAAGMAAMTRLLIASLLFSALLVGTEGLDALPGAVLAAASAWVVTTAITQHARGADGATGSPGKAKRTV